MPTAQLFSLPRQREVHFGNRVVWCFRERPNDIYSGFLVAVEKFANRTAMIYADRTWTYAELEAEAGRVAAGLSRQGVTKGNRVVLLIGNRPEFVTLALAILRLGAVAVPMDVRLQSTEIQYVLDNSRATLLLYEDELADRLPSPLKVPAIAVTDAALFPSEMTGARAAPAAVAEEDPAMILYTSGTTGSPKGGVLTHLNFSHSAIHHSGNLGLDENDRSLIAVPLSHVTGIICGIVAPLWTGGTLILLPRFKAREFLEAASQWRMTYTIMVPAMYNLCLRVEEFDSYDLSAWRLGHYGASPMPEDTLEKLARKLPALTLVSGYGATETCSPALMTPVGQGRQPINSAGRALPCAEVMIVDPETCIEVAQGSSGELWIRGPMVASGYWDNPEATARGFVGGFWRSGDIGRVDSDGNVQVHDRLKDVINRAGYKIYSAEVEAVLAQIPEVIESAIIGYADPVLGERVHAVVTVAADVCDTELSAYCARHLADYKVPESWAISRDPLPRNSMGKVDKRKLRENFVAPETDRKTQQ
tara:strand:+ start:49307 stop:50905 length:1599 start_codon:yes stop_codon:yes gene_type:complete